MTRRERLENKLEKRQEWAVKAETRSTAAFDKVHAIADMIPFGQPILVGHHSEGHARADQRRIQGGMEKGIQQQQLAEHHTSKADGLGDMLDTSIFSDDTDAAQALEVRIAERVAEGERCKEINKQIRKGPGWAARIQPALTDREKADLVSLAKVWGAAYKGAYPPYHLTGISASIRRDQKRIEEIKSQQDRTEKAEAAGGVLVVGDEYYVRVTFAEKSTRATIDALKANGFSWMGGSWVGQRDRLPEGIA